ncbi:unnamed protein product [Prunus armeniaca]|uniref:CCHC-type domain-containing protein n=1 Tax=Prunus armeniaca TaxID=36596 RepID=A0A6J5TQ10_PRUAR|nr:unnamed protein product [Prunus armeniaca]
MLLWVHANQDPGSVQMGSISESYLAQVAEGGAILPVQNVGIMTCRQCSGDCVIWEESIDERPWEKARSISPLKMKEDDEVDNLDIKLDVKKKSKRVYQSPPPEVGLKISRSLKSLNAKTGLFSKRMKIIHRDPMLHAQRVAAIKKAKGTAAARKRASEALKVFFSDPENRRKRSIAMKGVKFYCRHCGREGHRRHYCPELKSILINRQFVCGVCGEKGHNRRTCPKSRLSSHKSAVRRLHHCKICGQRGHNSRTCPKLIGVKSSVDIKKGFHSSGRRGAYKCKKGRLHPERPTPKFRDSSLLSRNPHSSLPTLLEFLVQTNTAMAMQSGIGFSKILILAGAGYTSTVLLKNGKLSDLIGELQSLLNGTGEQSEGDFDAIASQVRRLAAEVRQLGSSRQITVLNGNGSQIGLTSLIMPAATLGALGYGYMWWKGLKFSDLMYVTKRSMTAAVSNLHKHLESVTEAIANTKKHLTQRVQNLDDKLLEQKDISKSILENVGDTKGSIEELYVTVTELQSALTGLDYKLGSISEKQDVSNLGLFYLVNFVEGKQVEMPQQTKLKLTGNPRGRLVTYSETQSLMGLKEIAESLSGTLNKSTDAIVQDDIEGPGMKPRNLLRFE